MATVDQLNFKLIIDDSEFNTQINKVKAAAKSLNTDLSNILNLKNGTQGLTKEQLKSVSAVTQELAKITSAQEKIKRATEQTATAQQKNGEAVKQAAEKTRQAAVKTAEVQQKSAEKVRQEEERTRQSAIKTAEVQQRASDNAALAAERKRKASIDSAAAAQREAKASTDAATAKEREKRAVLDTATAKQREQQAMMRTAMMQRQLTSEVMNTNTKLSASARLWRQIGPMVTMYFSAYGAARLINNLIRVSAEFEKQKITLGAILKDTQAAGQLFEQIKDLAVMSPFTFKELMSYTKQLSAFSVPVEELYDTTKMLADVAAGLGVDMSRVILAFGQIRSASFLRGTEVRQLTEAGIPILEELRKQFVALGEEGVTVGDVFDKISRRMVPFEMVEKVFRDMTSEGGKFYQMQEVQATTLAGKISNLTDAYQIMFSEIGEKGKGGIVAAVDLARSLAENYEKVGKVIVSLAAAYGVYKATLIAVRAAEHALIQQNLALKFGRTLNMVQSLGVATGTLVKSTKAYATASSALSALNPYAAIAAAVAAMVGYLVSAEVQTRKFHKELEETADAQYSTAEKSVNEFHRLTRTIKETNEGSRARRDIIDEINKKYGDYLPNMLNEKNALDEIAKSEIAVTNAIYARARAYAETDGLSKIEANQGKKVSTAFANALDALNGDGIGQSVASDIMKGIRDYLSQNPGASSDAISMEIVRNMGKQLGMSFHEWVNGDMDKEYKSSIRNLRSYAEAVAELSNEQNRFYTMLDGRWGAQGYSDAASRNAIEPILKAYERAKAELDGLSLSSEEYQRRLDALNLGKLYQMKMAYEDLDAELASQGKQGTWLGKINEIQEQIDALKPMDSSWLQKIVNPLITGQGVNDLKAKAEDNYTEYIDNLRKEYKSTAEAYEDASKTYRKVQKDKLAGLDVDERVLKNTKEQAEELKNRKDIIESIGKALGISVNDKIHNSTSSAESAAKDRLQIQIDTVKELMQWYDRLKEAGMGEDNILYMLQTYFPEQKDIITTKSFKDELLRLANAIDAYDSKIANSIRNDANGVGLDKVLESFVNAKDAAKDYADFMVSWISSTELSGEGAEFNISKIVRDYTKTLEQIEKRKAEAREKLFAREDAKEASEQYKGGWVEELAEIDRLTGTETGNALAKANEEIRKQAKSWIEAWDGFKDVDLNHFADLTINELNKLKDAIDELSTNPISAISADTLAALTGTEGGVDRFVDALLAELAILKAKTDEQINQKKINLLKYASSEILKLADSLEELGEASGKSKLKETTEGIKGFADMAKRAVAGFKTGGWIGAVIAVLTNLGSVVLDDLSSLEELKDSIDSARLDSLIEGWDAKLSSSDSIFGDNTYRRMMDARDVMKQTSAALSDIGHQLESKEVEEYWISSYINPLGVVENKVDTVLAKILGFQANIFSRQGGSMKAYQDAIAKGYSELEAYIVKTKDRSGFLNWLGLDDKYMSLKDMFASVGQEMYDAFGNLNTSGLQKILESYDELDAEDREWMENAIKYGEEYTKALQQVDDALEALVGDIAGDFADAMVDQWLAAGDAASDYSDILSDIAKNYAKMIIQNALLENVFDEDFKERLNKLTAAKDAVGIMELFDKKMEEIKNWEPFSEQVLSGLNKYFTDRGSESASLPTGIKSITEETAGLLASYVNAIRADVAFNKMQLSQIIGLLQSAPTLADHLAQIQANTFNTAEASMQIMNDLKSMMTTSDGPALRVFM